MIDEQLLQQAAVSAKACEASSGFPASITLAQAILETGWFEHIPEDTWNALGIKAYTGCYGVKALETTEVVNGQVEHVTCYFATFPSLQACFEKHAELLTTGQPYQMAWRWYLKQKDPIKLAGDIAHVYATDPQYAAKIQSLMRSPTIQQALQDVPVQMAPEESVA